LSRRAALLDPHMKREKITVPVTLLDADVTQMSGKDQLKARSEGLFYIAEGDQKKPFAAEVDALTAEHTLRPAGCSARRPIV